MVNISLFKPLHTLAPNRIILSDLLLNDNVAKTSALKNIKIKKSYKTNLLTMNSKKYVTKLFYHQANATYNELYSQWVMLF